MKLLSLKTSSPATEIVKPQSLPAATFPWHCPLPQQEPLGQEVNVKECHTEENSPVNTTHPRSVPDPAGDVGHSWHMGPVSISLLNWRWSLLLLEPESWGRLRTGSWIPLNCAPWTLMGVAVPARMRGLVGGHSQQTRTVVMRPHDKNSCLL
jgi:hypothetical protein